MSSTPNTTDPVAVVASSHADAVLAQAESILAEAMAARRRYAADLAHYSLDEPAFEKALESFHQRYAVAYGNSLRAGATPEEAHSESLDDAAQILLMSYLREAGR